MTQVNLPEDRQWTQPNTSVLFGNIYESKNIDFSLPGFLKLAPRTRYIGREDASTATFEYLLSSVYMSPSNLFGTKKYFLLTNDKIFTADTNLTNFAALGVASEPTLSTASDAVASGLYYVVSTATEMSYFTTIWTNNIVVAAGGAVLDSNSTHPLCISFNGLILIGDRNKVNQFTVNTSGLPSTYTSGEVVLPLAFSIVWIRSFANNIWIGTRNLINGNARVFQWDASSDNFNQEFEVDCQWVYSGCDWEGNFYIFTNDGRLMAFNGAGFSEVARLPAYTDIIAENNYVFGNAYTLGSVFQRGMTVVDGKIHILINAEATTDAGSVYDATNRMPSGIWVYDPAVGLYNKYCPSNSTSATNTDFGQMALEDAAGALTPIFADPTTSAPFASSVGGTLLYGAKLNSPSTTNHYTFGSVTSGENRGYFATNRIESPDLQESWRYVFLKYEEFENDEDAIILKYKTKNRENLPFTTTSDVTWTSSTVFTSTDTKFASVVAGDEVTILTGAGAGSTAHVSTIAYANPTYTVTLDEAITAVVDTNVGKVAVDNYHKLSPSITPTTVTTDQPNANPRYAKIAIPVTSDTDYQPAPSEWIQVKTEMRGQSIRISAMSLLSETQVKIIV